MGVNIVNLQINNGHTEGYYRVIITANNSLQKTADELLNHLQEIEGIEDIKYTV